LRGVADPRLAVHATSSLPAWLWSIDGTRVLWANPVAADRSTRATARISWRALRSGQSAPPQVIQLANRLPLGRHGAAGAAARFGAALGG